MSDYHCSVPKDDPRYDSIKKLHDDAVAKGEFFYKEGRYRVATVVRLRLAGECCGAKCRHCPYPDQK